MANLYKKFLAIIPDAPLLVGVVSGIFGDEMLNVDLLGGGTVRVTGEAQLNDRVFVQDGLVIGKAPTLPQVSVTIF